MKLGMQVGLGPGHIVLDEASAPPPPKGHSSHNFRLTSVVAKWLDGFKMPPGMEVGFGPGDFVLDGVPAPPPGSPQFLAHVYCGQTAGWIKMALGIEVGLGPGHIVLDGDPALPPLNGHSSPQFSANVRCGKTAMD